jgi:hypothetical protein
VENPINLSYSELQYFPQVSEVAELQCRTVAIPPVLFNWTGVPLFYLLSLAGVVPGDYREVVFHGSDNYSKGVLLETAMHPTSIIALKGNDTDLEQVDGFGGGYRVVFPCRWGYKWVKWIDRITVIDYVFTGSDPALMPNCTMPETNPPWGTFNLTDGSGSYVDIMSNSSIESVTYEDPSQLTFSVEGEEGQRHFWYVSYPKTLMASKPFVFVDGKSTYYYEVDSGQQFHLYFEQTISSSDSIVEILSSSSTQSQNSGGEGKRPLYIDK